MYKSSLFAHLARAGRQHPFFSQNVNNANSTALSLVKPKLGVTTEKAYFSSWGAHGQNASNAGGLTTSQSVLVALSSDDSQAWERDLGVHRKQFRSIAGIRRYSTGTQTVTEEQSRNATLHLEGEGFSSAPVEPSETAEDVPLGEAGQTLSKSHDVSVHPEVDVPFENHCFTLYEGRQYVPLLQHLMDAIKAEKVLSRAAYGLLFKSLNRLDTELEVIHQVPEIFTKQGPSLVLHYYSLMLESGVLPDQDVYTDVLTYFNRHALDVVIQEKILKGLSFARGLAQEELAQTNIDGLEYAKAADAGSAALDIFKASNSVTPTKYSAELLENLLSACTVDGKVDEAIGIFDHYDKTGLQRTADTYRLMLTTFAAKGDMAGAVACFQTWKEERQSLPRHDYFEVYDALIRCMFAVGDHVGALAFFTKAVRENGGARAKDYENMIRCYSSHGLFDQALAFARRHRQATPYALSRALGTIAFEACSQGKPEIARFAFNKAESLRGFDAISSATWRYLGLLISEGQLDDAKELVDNCVRENIDLRVIHLSCLVTKCLEAGRVDDAFQIMGYIGERRAIRDIAELNRGKVVLFMKIFLDDLTRLNLLDASTGPRVIEVLSMLGRNSNITPVRDMLPKVRTFMKPDDWLRNPVLFSQICMISFHFLQRRDYHSADQDSLMSPQVAKGHLEWLVETLEHLYASGYSSVLSAAQLHDLQGALTAASLPDEVLRLEQLAKSTSPDHGLSQLLPVKAIFRSEYEDGINAILSREIWKTLVALDTSAYRSSDNSPRIPYTRMLSILKKCAEGGPTIQGNVFVKLLEHLGRVHEVDHLKSAISLADELLPNMILSPELLPAARAQVYNSAVLAFNETFDNVTAQLYHDRVLDLGFIPSANAYASFIAKMDERVYRDGAARAMSLFAEAKRMGIRSNEYLYNTVIAKLAKARRNDEALALFEEMKSLGLAPNGVTYGTIINSCCRVGKTEQAESLLSEMESLPGNSSRIAPYNTLLQHFVQVKKDKTKAFHYWDRLRARAIPPTAHSYRLLIEAHGHLEPVDPVAAESVIGLMQVNRLRCDSIHHAAMIHMYGSVLGDLASAHRYFNFWKTKGKPDDIMYQSIIEAHVAAKDLAGVQDLMKQMDRDGVQTNAYIVNLVIQVYAESGHVDRARTLFDQLPSSGAGSRGKEPSTYETMIRAYNSASQPERGAEIFDLLKDQHYPEAVVQRAAALVGGRV